MKTPQELLRAGGAWLGAARKWLQRNTRNGDRITWGSDDVVGEFNARMCDEFAAEVAVAAFRQSAEEIRTQRLSYGIGSTMLYRIMSAPSSPPRWGSLIAEMWDRLTEEQRHEVYFAFMGSPYDSEE